MADLEAAIRSQVNEKQTGSFYAESGQRWVNLNIAAPSALMKERQIKISSTGKVKFLVRI